tara:strand:- start:439 stop:945 length:507 start_codon:yes stop_codon:yes gene_type:complete
LSDPLIVTAELPQDLYSWATQLRAQHFPPERNYLKAHVTLFHALPPFCRDEAGEALARLAGANAPVPARLDSIMNLGRGTALRIESPAMLDLRAELAHRFHGLLTPQDEHSPRLHITVQNKVTPAEARELQAQLSASFAPRDFEFRGFELHTYRGGPWDFEKRWRFRG